MDSEFEGLDVLQFIVLMQTISLCRSYSGKNKCKSTNVGHIQTYQYQHVGLLDLYFVLIHGKLHSVWIGTRELCTQ